MPSGFNCCSGWSQFKDFGETSSINNLAGTISWIFGMLLWGTSINWVRRRYYQTFHSVHMLGFLGYTLFALLHYTGMWVSVVPGNYQIARLDSLYLLSWLGYLFCPCTHATSLALYAWYRPSPACVLTSSTVIHSAPLNWERVAWHLYI